MPARTCPFCGVETPPYRDGHWQHVRRCEKNPDPTCPKCGLHFVSYKIAGHIERCGTHKKREPAADPATASEASTTAAAEKPAASAPVLEVPAERRTPTDELVLPLMAAPTEKPAPPPATAKPRRGGRRRAVAPAPQPAAPSGTPERGLVATFEDREPPRTTAWASFGDSLKRNWVLLAVIAVGLVLIILWRRLNADDDSQLKAPVQPSPPPSTSRPPYNPELHGSLEQYRATYAHAAPNGGS